MLLGKEFFVATWLLNLIKLYTTGFYYIHNERRSIASKRYEINCQLQFRPPGEFRLKLDLKPIFQVNIKMKSLSQQEGLSVESQRFAWQWMHGLHSKQMWTCLKLGEYRHWSRCSDGSKGGSHPSPYYFILMHFSAKILQNKFGAPISGLAPLPRKMLWCIDFGIPFLPSYICTKADRHWLKNTQFLWVCMEYILVFSVPWG